MGRGAHVSLLAFVLFLTLQSTPASALTKCFLVLLEDLGAVSAVLAAVTNSYSILYFYNDISGIALQIDDGLVQALGNQPQVLAVIPDRVYKLHTTRSWEFLQLETSGGKATDGWKAANFGEGVIIANLDTGVAPTSESFRDEGVQPVSPLKWRGTCEAASNKNYGCNNKLIGARVFNKGIQAPNLLSPEEASKLDQTSLNSPWDYEGHGSHTLSTAGGGFVPSANVFGHGNGTAKGGSPRAWVASYKVCFAPGCSSLDILMAMLTAVNEGVHVLSLSLGSPPSDYVSDPIAIGALYAVKKRVTVVASAGNSGPQPGSVSNLAPWILTVAASTMDRDFPAQVTYGDGTVIKGQSLSSSTEPAGEEHLMISGDKANAADQSADSSALCLAGSLDPAKVKDKIVVCTRGGNGRVEKGLVVKQAGGVGMVLCNGADLGESVIADPHLIAAAHCSYSQCRGLFEYIQSTKFPVGYITAQDAAFGVKPAPRIAGFSSRGPNTITPQILKPDITAPGVSVIAAYSKEVSVTELPFDDRRSPYNIMSGTSMSCPHVAGIAGLLKNKYPEWSPAMIKSAIMTTASTGDNLNPDKNSQIQDETGAAATPFSYGSGHVRPVLALDPGLVYDTTPLDYANFFCSLKPTQPLNLLPVSVPLPLRLLRVFFFLLFGPNANNPFTCSLGVPFRPENLNYPSISATCLSVSKATTVKRRVMNVGAAYSTYTVTVVQPAAGVKIRVVPDTLRFGKIYEEKEFTVELVVTDATAAANYAVGSIEWSDSDGKHRVRSPVVATTKCAA